VHRANAVYTHTLTLFLYHTYHYCYHTTVTAGAVLKSSPAAAATAAQLVAPAPAPAPMFEADALATYLGRCEVDYVKGSHPRRFLLQVSLQYHHPQLYSAT
jgi:hypothetical protein